MKQVAGGSVASGDPQEVLEASAYHCQAHRAFLVTFRASGEGRKELVGMRRVGGPPGSWAVLRRKLPRLPLSKVPCPGERLGDVGVGG